MNRPHAAMPETEIEARLRAALRRHAEDVEPTAPPWPELMERAGAVVLPLHGTELPPAHLAGGRRLPRFDSPWVRPTLAAAVALTIALSSAVVIQSRLDDGDGTGDNGGADPAEADAIFRNVPDSRVVTIPGDEEFRAEAAVPLALAQQERIVSGPDPSDVGRNYLQDIGLVGDVVDQTGSNDNGQEVRVGPAELATVETATGPVEIAKQYWSVWEPGNQLVASGALWLRLDNPLTNDGLWHVVGGYTEPSRVFVDKVRRSEGLISFALTDYISDPDLDVRVAGEEVNPSVPITDDDVTAEYVLPDVAPGQVIVIEARHMVDGVPITVTSFALLPPDGIGDVSVETIPGTAPLPEGITRP